MQKVPPLKQRPLSPNSAQNHSIFNGTGCSIRGIKSGKLKKLQITHRIDDGLQHENPRWLILTSIEFVQENSPDIQTLIKKLHDLILKDKFLKPNLIRMLSKIVKEKLNQRV